MSLPGQVTKEREYVLLRVASYGARQPVTLIHMVDVSTSLNFSFISSRQRVRGYVSAVISHYPVNLARHMLESLAILWEASKSHRSINA
jgi:hypothetical protein